jgi:hypothetical protein
MDEMGCEWWNRRSSFFEGTVKFDGYEKSFWAGKKRKEKAEKKKKK